MTKAFFIKPDLELVDLEQRDHLEWLNKNLVDNKLRGFSLFIWCLRNDWIRIRIDGSEFACFCVSKQQMKKAKDIIIMLLMQSGATNFVLESFDDWYQISATEDFHNDVYKFLKTGKKWISP